MSQPRKILRKALLFCTIYCACLILWLYLKPCYGKMVTRIGAETATLFFQYHLAAFDHDKNKANIRYSRMIYAKKGIGELVVDLQIDVSNYTFNVPLTLALVSVLLPVRKWKSRTMIDIFLILFFIHFCYIFFYISLHLYSHLPSKKAPSTFDGIPRYFLEFMWAFCNSMVVKFEPFLVALYVLFKKKYSIFADR